MLDQIGWYPKMHSSVMFSGINDDIGFRSRKGYELCVQKDDFNGANQMLSDKISAQVCLAHYILNKNIHLYTCLSQTNTCRLLNFLTLPKYYVPISYLKPSQLLSIVFNANLKLLLLLPFYIDHRN